MTHRYMKKRWTSLAIRELKIRTTMRCHLIPVRMAVTNKSTNSKMWRKRNPRSILVGMQTGTTTVENSLEFPQKTKNGTALWPSNSTTGKSPESPIQKNLGTAKFIAAQFTIAKYWKQPKSLSVNKWFKNYGTFTQWNTTAKRKKELLPFMTAWMELENIMPGEIRQLVKDKYHMTSPMRGM